MQAQVASGESMEYNNFGPMTNNDLAFLSMVSEERVQLHEKTRDELDVELEDLFSVSEANEPDPILYHESTAPLPEHAAQRPEEHRPPPADEPCDLVTLQWLNEHKRGGRWGVYKNDVFYAHGTKLWKYNGDDEFVIESELQFDQLDEIDKPDYFEEPQVKLIVSA